MHIYAHLLSVSEWFCTTFWVSTPQYMGTLLHWWLSNAVLHTVQTQFTTWLHWEVSKRISKEGETVSQSGVLKMTKWTINKGFFSSFDLCAMGAELERMCALAFVCFHALSTTARQEKEQTETAKDKREKVRVLQSAVTF